MRKVWFYVGLILFFVGAMAGDSDSIIAPLALIIPGLVLMYRNRTIFEEEKNEN